MMVSNLLIWPCLPGGGIAEGTLQFPWLVGFEKKCVAWMMLAGCWKMAFVLLWSGGEMVVLLLGDGKKKNNIGTPNLGRNGGFWFKDLSRKTLGSFKHALETTLAKTQPIVFYIYRHRNHHFWIGLLPSKRKSSYDVVAWTSNRICEGDVKSLGSKRHETSTSSSWWHFVR